MIDHELMDNLTKELTLKLAEVFEGDRYDRTVISAALSVCLSLVCQEGKMPLKTAIECFERTWKVLDEHPK